MTHARVTLILAALAVGACGGSLAPIDLDASTDGAPGADAAKLDAAVVSDASPPTPTPFDGGSYDFCKASAARATKCGDGFDPKSCAQQAACFAGAMRPQSAFNVEQCYTSSPCGTISDKCVAIEELKFQGDPAVQKYYADCKARSTACGGQPTSDTCATFGVLSDSARTQLASCLNVACGAISTCVKNVGTSLGCK